MGNKDVFHYVLTNSSYGRLEGDVPRLQVVWFEAGYPEMHEGYRAEDPEGYRDIALQQEQQRLDALGIGMQ